MVLVGDVPVQANQEFLVAVLSRETGERTRIVPILLANEIAYTLHIFNSSTAQILVRIGRMLIVAGTPTVDHRGGLLHFAVDEEEELILDYGTAKGQAIDGVLILLAGTGNLLTVDSIALHVLILMIDVCRTFEGVRTRLRNGVHATTDEVGLAHVEGRDDHLHFLDSIDRDGVTTTRQTC